jgi:hypothetical protein
MVVDFPSACVAVSHEYQIEYLEYGDTVDGFQDSFNTEVGDVSPTTSISKDTEKGMNFGYCACSLTVTCEKLALQWEMHLKSTRLYFLLSIDIA